MGNFLEKLGDRIVMALDSEYDPQEYAWKRYSESKDRGRQIHDHAEDLARRYNRLVDRHAYLSRSSSSEELYALEDEIRNTRKAYNKALRELERTNRETDRYYREYLNSTGRSAYYDEPKYNPDERVRIEEITGEYDPELSFERVGKWMDDALRRRPWRS